MGRVFDSGHATKELRKPDALFSPEPTNIHPQTFMHMHEHEAITVKSG